MKELYRFRRRGLNWIGDSNETGGPAVDGDQHHGLPLLAEILGAFHERLRINGKLFQQLGAARGNGVALNRARDTLAC